MNPTQSLLLDSCDFSNPSPFSSLPARTVRLSPRPRPSTPPPSPPPSPRHQSSPEESKPLSYDKSYFQVKGPLMLHRITDLYFVPYSKLVNWCLLDWRVKRIKMMVTMTMDHIVQQLSNIHRQALKRWVTVSECVSE